MKGMVEELCTESFFRIRSFTIIIDHNHKGLFRSTIEKVRVGSCTVKGSMDGMNVNIISSYQ